ncbi:MAG: hypothetical protein HFJ03_07970 [Lachnospira sp.]|nr:hypothetical protein [Lachnospira sp.]
MKEYLKRLARGNFTYDIPQLDIDTKRIVKAACNSVIRQSFVLKSDLHTMGIIWSQNDRVVIRNNVFSGTECKIDYEIYTKGLLPNDSMKGTFDIISISGEKQIPYEIQIVDKVCETSIGIVDTVFDFYNLAHQSIDEAVQFFDSNHFKNIVLKEDILFVNIYDILKMDSDRSHAMFEFLVAAHKKSPVTISMAHCEYKYGKNVQVRISKEDKALFDIMDCSDNKPYKLWINKSGWGYVKVKLKTDASFIQLSNEELNSNDFTGNQGALSFSIDIEKLHSGTNFGRIELLTYNQKLTADVIVHCKSNHSNIQNANFERRLLMEITRLYVDYRLENIDTKSWITQYTMIVNKLRDFNEQSIYYQLMEIQGLTYQDRMVEAKNLLESIDKNGYQQDVLLFCYYSYISTMIKKDDVYTIKMASVIRDYYENGLDNWRILWMLFYMDKNYSRNLSMKLLRIKEAFKKGCFSPVMYYEALTVINSDPMLVRILNDFEIRVLSFGLKHKKITQRLADYINYLILNEKMVPVQVIDIAKKLYETFKQDNMLETLVIHMIRNEMCSLDCFQYYEKAVLKGLKITRLYEFYIKSMDKSSYKKLPDVVLMYFQYEVHLNYVDRAYLYANILTENTEVCSLYEDEIQNFGYEQLCMDRIDENLKRIYKYIWNIHLLDNNTAESMVNLMFTYKVTCLDKEVRYVIVKHKELTLLDRYPIIDGTAYITMFTKGCVLAFECMDGSIHKDTLEYEIEKVFENTDLLQDALNQAIRNEYIEFYKFEMGSSFDMADTVKYLAGLKGLEEHMRATLNTWLIDYYYNNKDQMGTQNSTAINRKEIQKYILLSHLKKKEAIQYIDICSSTGMFDTACDLIENYGIDGISFETLYKIANFLLEKLGNVHDVLLLDMCFKSFSNGHYNEKILSYLNDNFNGTSDEMYRVWKACSEFEIDKTDISERIVAQMLFCSQQDEKLIEVFNDYYTRYNNDKKHDMTNSKKRIIMDAYICYQSYLYFVKQNVAKSYSANKTNIENGLNMNEFAFTVIENYLTANYKIHDICKLAYLKYMSKNPDIMTETQKNLVETLISELCEENQCFEFYKKFGDVVCLPYTIINQTYVQYIGNPDAKVNIYFYKNENESDMEHEIITGCCGVYTKGFTLFYGDRISYYFTEETKGELKRSNEYQITGESVFYNRNISKFDYINEILACKEKHDITTMKKQMQTYCINEYIVDQVFQVL